MSRRTFAEHVGQVVEREADDERALNELYALHAVGWIAAVAARRPRRSRQQALPFVVPERVGADAREARELPWAERRAAIPHDYRFLTSSESPVL